MTDASQQQSYADSLRFIVVQNDTGFDVPAHGLVEVVGASDDNEVFTALRPRSNGVSVYVNGPVRIPDGMKGQVTRSGPIIIACEATPAVGETWGAKEDSFLAALGNSGFKILEAGTDKAWADRYDTAGGSGFYVQVESDTPVGDDPANGWVANRLDYTTGDALPTGIEVRLLLTKGDSFLIDGHYWAEDGSDTIDDVPIYWAPGEVKWAKVPFCDPDDPETIICKDLWMHPNFRMDVVSCEEGEGTLDFSVAGNSALIGAL